MCTLMRLTMPAAICSTGLLMLIALDGAARAAPPEEALIGSTLTLASRPAPGDISSGIVLAQAPTPLQPASKPARGMLDDVPDTPGQTTIIRGNIQKPAAPSPSTTAPPAAATATSKEIADRFRAVLARGIPVSPQLPNTIAAAAVEEIASECKAPKDKFEAQMTSLQPAFTTAKQSLKPLQAGGKPGTYLVISIAAPDPLSDGLACLNAMRATESLRLELIVQANDFGPREATNVAWADLASVGNEVNAHFGDQNAGPWRTPTSVEIFALMRILYDEGMWGPNGRSFWASDAAAGGAVPLYVTGKHDKPTYRATLETADAAAKAGALWVRSKSR